MDKRRGIISSMFDRIASRYDFLNRFLSGGQDVVWRKKLAKYLPSGRPLLLLDVATGTGDVPIMLMQTKNGKLIEHATGVDISEQMLAVGRVKLKSKSLDQKIKLETGDATALAFSDKSFDVVSIAFGIRNVISVEDALSEFFRVLKPGGRVLILEFSLPSNAVLRALYLFYFRNILPKIGAVLSGDGQAYRYLNESVESFPYGQKFLDLMAGAGFEKCQFQALTFGVANIYIGDKRG